MHIALHRERQTGDVKAERKTIPATLPVLRQKVANLLVTTIVKVAEFLEEDMVPIVSTTCTETRRRHQRLF